MVAAINDADFGRGLKVWLLRVAGALLGYGMFTGVTGAAGFNNKPVEHAAINSRRPRNNKTHLKRMMMASLLKLWANCDAQTGRINNYFGDGWEWSPRERTPFAIKATINIRQDTTTTNS